MRHRPLSALVAAGAIFALLSSGISAPVSADTQTAASPRPLSVTDCSTAQLSGIVAAYLTAPSPRATPIPIPGAQSYLAYILRERLAQCSAILGGYHAQKHGPPPPAAACSPSAHEKSDVSLLWAHLTFCESLVHPPVTVSPTIGWQIPPTSGAGNRPVIFVIGGGGGDAAMVGKLISTLAVYLNDGKVESGYRFAGDAVLIPEPTWSPEVYAAQCEHSPQVEGAIVVQITAAGSGATDEFIRRRNWTAIEGTALYAQCVRHAPSSQGVPSYVWVSDIAQSENQHVTLTPLTPLALVLTLGAAYEEFAPAKQTTTASTTVFPNPTPIPATGKVSQIVTTNQTTRNAGTLSTVAGGFLTYTNGAAPLTQGPAVDQQTWDTLQSLAMVLIKNMNCWQPAPEPITPNAKDVVGKLRTLPAYNPPAGLGEFSSGAPSAPFCSEPGASESINDILPAATPTPQPTSHR
jgi:hypothetical protein